MNTRDIRIKHVHLLGTFLRHGSICHSEMTPGTLIRLLNTVRHKIGQKLATVINNLAHLVETR